MKNENFTKFYCTFLMLCEKSGYTVHGAAKAAGISSGAPTAWKNGAIPREDQRDKLCALFSVTDDELMGYEKSPDPVEYLSDAERELVAIYRRLNIRGRERLLEYARETAQLYVGDNGLAMNEAAG